jgi:hypothetical protein
LFTFFLFSDNWRGEKSFLFKKKETGGGHPKMHFVNIAELFSFEIMLDFCLRKYKKKIFTGEFHAFL